MHIYTLQNWRHGHDFSLKNEKGERRTLYVLVLTALTMVVEIVAGILYGSMALLADGWHMGTHVAAFVITLFAYHYARKHANNPAYTFGTGKVNVLGGFASAVALAVVALVMFVESLERIISPQLIHFNQAILVASIGLGINIISAFLLKDHHEHHHEHAHEHEHHHEEHSHEDDHNLRAAYIHVLADALTSLLAIVALLSGKFFAWNWLDPLMGMVGAVIITRWSYGLLRLTSPVLLDAAVESRYKEKIQMCIEKDMDNRVVDCHVWKVGNSHYAAIIALVTHYPQEVAHYKALLNDFSELSHVTIEVNVCEEKPCISPQAAGA